MIVKKDVIMAYVLKNAISHKGKAYSGAVISGLFNEGLKKEDVKKTMPKVQEIISEISKLSFEEQEKAFEKFKDLISEREIREGLPELPDVDLKKGVIMRFAPSPSGALHIGHAITACLSYDYVKKYGGKFIVRIEDTNPENIYPKAYNLIKKDSDFLFNKEEDFVIQSDRMDLYYSYAVALIEKGSAYVCECDGDEFRDFAKKKKNCLCRIKSIERNIKDWENMLNKKGFGEGEAILRFKTPDALGGMAHKNPAMRDFPLARINETKHPRQSKKYRVWPLMNLSVAVDDIEMGMTHIIRAKEHRDNSERQKMIFEVFERKFPWTGFLGRIHFDDMELSASQITKDIESGKYSGWDDPKLPTIQALMKKYKPEAFWRFSEHRGLSEVDKHLQKAEYFRLLDEFNK